MPHRIHAHRAHAAHPRPMTITVSGLSIEAGDGAPALKVDRAIAPRAEIIVKTLRSASEQRARIGDDGTASVRLADLRPGDTLLIQGKDAAGGESGTVRAVYDPAEPRGLRFDATPLEALRRPARAHRPTTNRVITPRPLEPRRD